MVAFILVFAGEIRPREQNYNIHYKKQLFFI